MHILFHLLVSLLSLTVGAAVVNGEISRGGDDKNEDFLWLEGKKSANQTGIFVSNNIHILRLVPDEDLLECLFKYAKVLNLKAVSIVSIVGSLRTTNIKYANQKEGTVAKGHFEIVSVVGNIEAQGSMDDESSGHVHLAVSDESGVTVGGHMLPGNIIYTTAEVTMVEMVHGRFERQLDAPPPEGSGYYELQVHHDGERVN